MSFVLDIIDESPLVFSLHLTDPHGGETLLHTRGTGLRKMLTLIVSLMKIGSNERALILFDEPETSLHADNQHALRTLLEDLTTSGKIQVVYTTHSPAMINSVRPDGVRLLERTNVEGKPTSVIQNRPIQQSFQPVRASLGISPADSLLYAPLTVVVEGPTETLTLASLLLRLQEAAVPGFEQVDRLLSLAHFIDCEGDSVEYWFRLVKSQGCKPLLFVDGDKIRRIRQLRLDEKHPDVPVVTLPEGKEFEDMVPREAYIQALASTVNEQLTGEAFTTWEKGANLPKQMMFTKRIDKWLQETAPGTAYDKPAVMKQALVLFCGAKPLVQVGMSKIVCLVRTCCLGHINLTQLLAQFAVNYGR